MKTITTIPGIKAVHIIRTSLLPPHINLKTLCAISIYVPDNIRKICVEGVPQVEIVSEYINNGRQVTVTLKFSSADMIDTSVPYSFVYTDLLGDSYLIGCKEKPHPVLTSKQGTGVPGSSSAVIEYEVRWLSDVTPARCFLNWVD